MEKRLLNFIKCLDCHGANFELATKEFHDDDIISGTISCQDCKRHYEIRDGIVIALPHDLSALEINEIESSDNYSIIENNEFKEGKLRRLMYDYQFSYLDSFINKESLLEIGSGNGYLLEKHKNEFGIILGVDISFNALSNAKNRGILNLIQADAKKLPIKDNSFSNIVTQGMLHHVDSVQKCLEEMFRVRKKISRILIQDKNQNNFFIPLMDKIILKGILKKIGEVSFIKHPIHHSQIKNFIKDKTGANSKLCYHDFIAWPSQMVLEIAHINNNRIIQIIFLLDRVISKIPFLSSIFCWRFSIIVE